MLIKMKRIKNKVQGLMTLNLDAAVHALERGAAKIGRSMLIIYDV